MDESQMNENNTCVVCFKNVLYYSIGECDHPVCYECSTRMRVLCVQNECPICRQNLSKVVFTDYVQPFKELRNKAFPDKLFERQFKIGFCNAEIKEAYERLLENKCNICEGLPPFRSLSLLSEHMRKVHERYYCDLCVEHLKIFTNERRCYTRKELAHHRRKGDVDDKSHRGHPLCEFCDKRFMDADELYRHLRKEHLYCHFCDADGKNLYYVSHPDLAHHFRTEHYLCEEGDCAGQHLTSAFRTEIDLKAHKATVHGKGLARGAARQARTLELQFNITPHGIQRVPRERERSESPPAARAPAAPPIDPRSDEQFPRLSAHAPAPALVAPPPRTHKSTSGLKRDDKNFPALEGAGRVPAPAPRPGPPLAATVLTNSKPSVSIQVHSQPSASNFRLTNLTGNRISIPGQSKGVLSDDDFPSLSSKEDLHPNIGAGTLQSSKVKLVNSEELNSLKNTNKNTQPKKVPLSAEAFPSLSNTVLPSAPPQWITVSKSKEKPKPKLVAQKPKEPPVLNTSADFPKLPANSKNKPQKPTTTTSQASFQVDFDKNKPAIKKQISNDKKENSFDVYPINGIDKKYFKENIEDAFVSLEVDKKVKTISDNNVKEKNKSHVNFSLKTKDYPPLSKNGDGSAIKTNNFAVNGFAPALKSKPSDVKQNEVMTFTNSSGQIFPAPIHAYIPPPNFEVRNCKLMQNFINALTDQAEVEQFKSISKDFRVGTVDADAFYQHCKAKLGSQFDAIFPELVALLPDIAKQQELVVGKSFSPFLEVCSTCGQLVVPNDCIAHDTAHWPSLG